MTTHPAPAPTPTPTLARIVACVNACEGIADPSAVPVLIDALRALDLRCVYDALNPCFAGRSTDVVGRHWGGAEACAPCTVAGALLKAEGRS